MAVMLKIDIKVDIAMEEESSSVSSPIFSAVIKGRLPAGTAAIRQRARVAAGSKPIKFIIRTIAIGTRIIRRMI